MIVASKSTQNTSLEAEKALTSYKIKKESSEIFYQINGHSQVIRSGGRGGKSQTWEHTHRGSGLVILGQLTVRFRIVGWKTVGEFLSQVDLLVVISDHFKSFVTLWEASGCVWESKKGRDTRNRFVDMDSTGPQTVTVNKQISKVVN